MGRIGFNALMLRVRLVVDIACRYSSVSSDELWLRTWPLQPRYALVTEIFAVCIMVSPLMIYSYLQSFLILSKPYEFQTFLVA